MFITTNKKILQDIETNVGLIKLHYFQILTH